MKYQRKMNIKEAFCKEYFGLQIVIMQCYYNDLAVIYIIAILLLKLGGNVNNCGKTMKKADKIINQIKLYQLNNKAVTELYSDLDLANRIVLQLYQIRQKYGYSQQELADKIGTTQSVIARMELKKTIPSLSFLNKVAKALKMELKIELVPIQNK
ncbi:hypothetical protein MASR1M45_28920 [Candidatus Kapaibacterium sp.]